MSKTHRLYAMTHSLYSGVRAVTSSSTRSLSGALNRSRELQSRGFTSGEIAHDSDTGDTRGRGHS